VALAGFASQPPFILIGLVLIDIGLTFGYPVGVTSQLRTTSAAISVLFAVMIGALSLRFKSKTLLLAGLLSYIISAIGCYIAPSFQALLLAYSLTGIGFALINSLSMSIIGEYLPIKRRSNVVGIRMASAALSYLIGSQAISFLSINAGWRQAFSLFVLPISVISLIVVAWGIPNKPREEVHHSSNPGIFEGFKSVFSNRSAIGCLLGYTLYTVTFAVLLVFNASFLRQAFLVSISFASITYIINSLGYIAANLFSGRIVKSIGFSKAAAISSLIAGISTLVYLNVPNLWISVIFALVTCTASGVVSVAGQGLALEQVPHFRSTMMSLVSASASAGSAIAGAVGGYVLILSGYGSLGYTMGILSIIATVVYYRFTIDPNIR